MKEASITGILFQESKQAVIVCSPDALIIDVNPAFTRITGYEVEEAVGRNPSFLSANRQDPGVYVDMWHKLLNDGRWSGELWNKSKDGRCYIEGITIQAEYNVDGTVKCYVGIFQDYTEEKIIQEKLRYRTNHDGLTKLYNRNYLEMVIDLYVEDFHLSKGEFSLLYVSIDSFQAVNDLSGQQQGDAVLRAYSRRLMSIFSSSHHVARVGGDEFCAILDDFKSQQELEKFAHILRAEISLPLLVNGISYELSSSIGGLVYSHGSASTPFSLLGDSAQAMAAVKKAGGNGVRIFDHAVQQQAKRDAIIFNELKSAIECGDIRVFYQRIECLSDPSQLYFEALVRWTHPEYGPISPLEFVSIAERNGTIDSLGQFVVETVCKQMREWMDQSGLVVKVAINVSPLEFSQRDMAARTLSSLSQYGLDSSCLGIEVTESQMLVDSSNIRRDFVKLRQQGINISLDDFGTGYSSLAFLKNIPIDVLKIDREFVRNIDKSERDRSIITSIIEMAHQLRLRVVAEGVENEKQDSVLRLAGCDYIQGYYYARPEAPENISLVDWSKVEATRAVV